MDEKGKRDLQQDIFSVDTDKMAANGHQARVDIDAVSTGPLTETVGRVLTKRKALSSNTCARINAFLNSGGTTSYITIERAIVRLLAVKPHPVYGDFMVVHIEVTPGHETEVPLYTGNFSMVTKVVL